MGATMRRMVLLLSAVIAGCNLLPKPPVPGPTPIPVPTPTPLPVPPASQQCHLTGAASECYDNPPNGQSFPQWQPNWGYVCAPDAQGQLIRAGEPDECEEVTPPDPGPGPTPPPLSGTMFPQGIPDDQFEKLPHTNSLRGEVNVLMAELSGCGIGSSCKLDMDADQWMNLVTMKMRDRGFNAGRHIDPFPGQCEPGQGCSDQISLLAGGKNWCVDQHSNQQIYEFGGGKVRWDSRGEKFNDWSITGSDFCKGGGTSPVPPDPPDPPDPDPQVCADPNPRGREARFVLKRIGNGNKITSTYQIKGNDYCRQVCSPVEPDVCYTTRTNCPVRIEGDPERVLCEQEPDVVGKQAWTCDGQPIEPSNPTGSQAICKGLAKTCTEDGATCAEIGQ